MIVMDIQNQISNCIIEASTSLSQDKLKSLKAAISNEDNDNARWVLEQVLENYNIASDKKLPLCDDTGIPHVIVELGSKRELTGELINQIHEGIALGLKNLPGRPMAVKGNDLERISQRAGLYDEPQAMKAAPILIDSSNDLSTYQREMDEDTLNIHLLLLGGGPEIRSKTYRVFHKRSDELVIDTACEWLTESLAKLGCTPSIPSIGIGRTHYEANSLMIKAIAYGSLDKQNKTEQYVTQKLNSTNIGPMGLGGKTTVLGSFVNIGYQRASGVRIVSIHPQCFVEPRVSCLKL